MSKVAKLGLISVIGIILLFVIPLIIGVLSAFSPTNAAGLSAWMMYTLSYVYFLIPFYILGIGGVGLTWLIYGIIQLSKKALKKQ